MYTGPSIYIPEGDQVEDHGDYGEDDDGEPGQERDREVERVLHTLSCRQTPINQSINTNLNF